ncbi:MAG TPA: hypothetical protein VE308_01085 [Nitrososphaera sp.]|nr:hypothetical protein [Nitrososphaera sp.]
MSQMINLVCELRIYITHYKQEYLDGRYLVYGVVSAFTVYVRHDYISQPRLSDSSEDD